MHRKPSIEDRVSLYAGVTQKVVSELEVGRLPWVQPWDAEGATCDLPHNAGTLRHYSGINVLILWHACTEAGWQSQRWLTYRQTLALGGNVRKGERGTTVCYADKFVPRDEAARAVNDGDEARSFESDGATLPQSVARRFLKRFTVFNIDQCENLPEHVTALPERPSGHDIYVEAEEIIVGSRADFRVGGDKAFYAPGPDFVQVPEQSAFHHPLDWYRTVFHELGHWTGHGSRLNREQRGTFGGPDYVREELVAEMASAFVCAALGIQPTVRHSDYIGAWLEVIKADERAIFRAASQASKAADMLLRRGGVS
ncbi:ArdC family protein [Sphingomonas sp. LaA6.9]|uniref:ArdC family protein n=1 Tax=Sphingomonas sp. LaA6.9 TaxID=2919914 RepID=UPI001F4F93C9|nr:zincin-like metallopeptidase domain-containing protein [Sphingomonas sp. LaA6.9]MCJ8158871.1 zincin-like metallopeptidase domain-containing protein [Sphingomonas sp. LaA6.9]